VDHSVVHGKPSRFRALARSPLRPLLLAGLTLLLAACAFDSYPQHAMNPKTEFARVINDLFWTIIYWSIIVFVVVEGLLIWALVRFKRRPGQPIPAQVHGNTKLEIAWTLAPALVLASIAVPTVRAIFETQSPPTPGSLQVRVVGHQWWWEFQYPQLNVRTANELWLPVGRKVDFALESADVIHSFWPPWLGGKRDVIPGHVNRLSFTPEAPDLYWGSCAEYCGASHANMSFRVIVTEQPKFDQWVQEMQNPKPPQSVDPLVQKGAQAFITSACIGCHRIGGTPAQGVIGPDLTYFGRRHTIAAGMMPNTPQNLAKWLKNPPAVKPGSLMPNLNLNDETVQALVAYLESMK
jgi:cytochrome c oxidase subunit 2